MTPIYAPVIIPEADPDVASLQEDITRHRVTHVKDRAGNVYRIFDRLNKKSVPLNHVDGGGPPRIPYSKVESFGRMIDPAPQPTEETTPDVLDPENLERALLQQAVIKKLKEIADDDKARIHHALANGEKRAVKNARGAELGSVYRTNPKPRFVIEDMAAVLPEAQDKGMEIIDLLPTDPGSPEYHEAAAILAEHAPELLHQQITKADLDALTAEVKEQWEITGQLPAGWAIQEGKDGYTAMRPNTTGKKVVEHMLSKTKDVLALTEGGQDE